MHGLSLIILIVGVIIVIGGFYFGLKAPKDTQNTSGGGGSGSGGGSDKPTPGPAQE